MNCPSCQAENPETARFCMHCGERLLLICPQCAAEFPVGANFCPSCGAPATQKKRGTGRAPGLPVNLEKYMPPELAARLAAQTEGGLQGERRIVTMLFCDLKGSTAAAEQLDPEAWTEILNGAFEQMIEPVYEYEGTVARLMGDAILAFFGAPIAHEDDPQRAVLAALKIQERIQAYRLEVQAAYGIDIATRIGINTGLVVAGEIGSDLRMEYTAVGDAINLAARMEQTAQPGTIQIAAATQRLVDPFFEMEALGEIEVKGKVQPVPAYRVLGIRQMPGQMHGQRRGLGARLAELVGRQAELAVLEQAVKDLAPAKLQADGRGAVFLIEGEAGLGKTTLVAEVQRRSALAGIHWLTGTALAYQQSTSYFPWREILRQSLDVPLGAQPPELRERLVRFGARHALPAETAAFLEALLGLEPAPDAELIAAYQGEELVLHLTRAVQETLERMTGAAALVLVFDDLQWADEASLDLLAAVSELVTRLPLLLICLARPDPEAQHASFLEHVRQNAGQRFQRITLSPLGEAETTQLTTQLLAASGLPEALTLLILSKADGNPLFVEELIRSLQESGRLVREGERWRLAQPLAEIALPEALNSLLSARIDRLPEKTRRVLQVASVFGSVFDSRHLHELLDSENLVVHLDRLQLAGMIHSDGAQLFLFSFHHTLTQEAAYQSLLHKDRRRLHTAIGELLERFYAGRLAEAAPLLAQHFFAAGDLRFIQYDVQAGDAAARLFANREAAVHYRRALDATRQADGDVAEIESLVMRLGQVLELGGQYADALSEYLKMEELARTRGAPAAVVRVLMAQATLYATLTPLHDPAQGEQKLAQALELAQETGDASLLARLHWSLMINALFSSRIVQALEHGEPAVQQARRAGDPGLLALSLNDMGRVYTAAGEYTRAQAALAEARGLWRDMDNQVMLADNLGGSASAYYYTGEYDQALAASRQALQISQEASNLWGQSYSYLTQGYIYLDRGEPDQAIEVMSRCIKLGDEAGLLASSIAVRADLACAYGAFGDVPRGLKLAQQALARAEADQPGWRPLPAAALVYLQLQAGRVDAAQAVAAEVPLEAVSIPFIHYDLLLGMARAELSLAEGQVTAAHAIVEKMLASLPAELRAGLPQVLLLKARVLLEQKRPAAAEESLLAAREIAAAIGARQPQWQILAMLADLAARGGRLAEARRLLDEAQSIINDIAERLEAVGLQAAFLASDPVQAVWPSNPAQSEAGG